MHKSTLSKTLRAIAAAMETLDPHELDALVAGKGKLMFVANDRMPVRAGEQSLDVVAITERLRACKDRDEARGLLAEITTKDGLSSIAKTLKIHVIKQDRREDIESKIVEFVIGGKLRSEAIQTLNMNGGGTRPSS
jgi:hypothetical protein